MIYTIHGIITRYFQIIDTKGDIVSFVGKHNNVWIFFTLTPIIPDSV